MLSATVGSKDIPRLDITMVDSEYQNQVGALEPSNDTMKSTGRKFASSTMRKVPPVTIKTYNTERRGMSKEASNL